MNSADSELRTGCCSEGRVFGLRAGQSPAGVAVVGIGKELEAAAANGALEVVFDDIGGPLRIEQVRQRTGALFHNEDALVDKEDQPAGEFEVVARLFETHTLHKAVALWAGRHWNSLTLRQTR